MEKDYASRHGHLGWSIFAEMLDEARVAIPRTTLDHEDAVVLNNDQEQSVVDEGKNDSLAPGQEGDQDRSLEDVLEVELVSASGNVELLTRIVGHGENQDQPDERLHLQRDPLQPFPSGSPLGSAQDLSEEGSGEEAGEAASGQTRGERMEIQLQDGEDSEVAGIFETNSRTGFVIRALM
ncbi:unnamed protein product, partial [Amoebophrya sp. A25]|eukprot:GSA25T00027341001.1